jgi:hypothetical protein
MDNVETIEDKIKKAFAGTGLNVLSIEYSDNIGIYCESPKISAEQICTLAWHGINFVEAKTVKENVSSIWEMQYKLW